MSRPFRKTVDVSRIRDLVNFRIADPTLSEDAGGKLCALLETVLMDAGQYQGYGHIHWLDEGGYADWVASGSATDSPADWPAKNAYITGGGSEYRRRYY